MDNALKLWNSLLRSRQSQQHIMLGEILKQRREELGLGVQDIARMTGMPPKQVVALEAGHAAYFAGGMLEVDRLMKLYAKKINMNVDSSFSAHLSADQKSDKLSAEVMIPAFLNGRLA
jgi:cytoskeletal protein RodZ